MADTELSVHHRGIISSAIYGEARACRIDLIRPPTRLGDSSAIYLVDGAYVLHVSPTTFPDAVRIEGDAVRAMRDRLGQAGHVLPPIAAEGRIDGRSFMAVPRLQPLSRTRIRGRIDRLRIRGAALAWVRALAALAEPPSAEATTRFSVRLAALAAMPDLAGDIASAAASARAALDSGAADIGHVPMHGDLWLGNLLRQADGSLCVIDWGGSQPHGYGIYDLMRLGDSLRIPPRIMRRELAAHMVALGGPQAARIHLLAALGHYAAHLGEFPRANFVAMANGVWRLFTALH